MMKSCEAHTSKSLSPGRPKTGDAPLGGRPAFTTDGGLQ